MEPTIGEKLDTPVPDFAIIKGKIALEEHFSIPETVDSSQAAHRAADVLRLIGEIGPDRIAEMDRGGVEVWCCFACGTRHSGLTARLE